MTTGESAAGSGDDKGARRATVVTGFLIAALGIIVGQAALYGPSLIGSRVLLPLRLLASPGHYTPLTPETRGLVPHNVTLGDLVYFLEPERRFVHSELKAGRPPLWTPYRFAGAPLYTLGLSPPWLMAYLVESPTILAWTQLCIALIAGLGMYYFCRRVLDIGLWPSAIAAWCYPLTGAYVFWIGQWIPAVMCWLPWTLAAVDRAIRSPFGWGGPALCLITVALIIGGAVDIAAQVLLVAGIYAIWRILETYRGQTFSTWGRRAIAVLALAWILGLAGASFVWLPLREYLANGTRVAARSAGAEERPPVGLASIPQVVLPDLYGSSQRGSFRIGRMVLPESSAAAYAGSIACLVLAPLAWFSRRRRSIVLFLAFIAVFSLGWAFDIPPLVSLLRLPGLNMMSHNRLAFVAAFGLLALAAIGCEVLLKGEAQRRSWFWIPALTFLALGVWCVYRVFVLPEPVATQLGSLVQRPWITDLNQEIATIQQTFRRTYAINVVFCGLGAAAWGLLLYGYASRRWFVPGLAVLLVGQLVYFGYGHAAQTEPELYFPKVAILDRIANETNGRIIGFNCLPANLAQAAGVRDVRGYDGIDPSRMVQLILAARNPKTHGPAYARTQTISPLMFSDSATGVPRVPPILDMLSVRYIVFRGAPPTGVQPAYADEDYWVLSNERALPRAYVPRHTDVISDDRLRLEALSSRSFNPLETAYLEHAVDLPSNIDGSVEFVEDTPQRITLSATMQTSGLVILADRWDPGWKAYVNDIAVPIWRVNHALRGVRVESGASELRFVYEPASLYKGLTISAAGSLAWFAWAGTVVVLRLRRKEFLPAAVVTAANSSEQPAPIINIGRRKENRRKTKRIRRSV